MLLTLAWAFSLQLGSRSIHVLGVYLHYLSCMSPTKTAGESIFLSILLQDVICKGNPMLFGSVAKSCPTFCNHVACTTPDFPVLHYLLEFAQIHAHWVGDATQPSSLSSPSYPWNSPWDSPGKPQYSFLENSMDRGAWQAIVHGVRKNQTHIK